MTESGGSALRVGFYGCGRFANRTHIPNLVGLAGVEIVALCDVDSETLRRTGERLPSAKKYAEADEMLASEKLDALYSCVPPFARTVVEVHAAERGLHLFSEKPQSLDIAKALEIDRAISHAGVVSTVGFRERYRPLFRQARRLLAGKRVVHVSFEQVRPLPTLRGQEQRWYDHMELSGGPALDWGVHAVDCVRFMTGQDIVQVRATYLHPKEYSLPLCCSFHLRLAEGGTMAMDFVSVLSRSDRVGRPGFAIYYEGGWMQVSLYDEITVNGEIVYHGEPFDPWLEQDRAFVRAASLGDASPLASDYHDGILTLAPVLAGWESARRDGESIDIARFLADYDGRLKPGPAALSDVFHQSPRDLVGDD